MRNACCPICGSDTEPLLRLRFNQKLNLPTAPEIRHCPIDNFLFLASGSQKDYDEYYRSLANDSYHAELSDGDIRSPIAKRQFSHLRKELGVYFDKPRKILDFGCGEASLLVELASEFPSCSFFGFDPGPATQIAIKKIEILGLENVSIVDLKGASDNGPYDFIIVSHVVEHLIDFELFSLLNTLLTENGLIYVEVPNALQYETHKRREFLYYFDRLHVNHFTPQSLSRLGLSYGLGNKGHFEYAFPYRDSAEYPALGMLFGKESKAVQLSSPSIFEMAQRYISKERSSAKLIVDQLYGYEGILVWGAGDNFFRSSENDGPISGLRNMVVLDRRQQEIEVGGRKYSSIDPIEGIRRHPWPVVITISEGRKAIAEQVGIIDPKRHIFFI